MLNETAMQCMRDIGLDGEKAEGVAALLSEGRREDARHKLRYLRCELMEQLHACQKRVDRLDWLIREIERKQD
ncbi:MAG: hypothetical protein II875_09140 [Clostridia bacterium]|nr:hypothetical protein [Clostridia bacterium]